MYSPINFIWGHCWPLNESHKILSEVIINLLIFTALFWFVSYQYLP